MKMAGTGHRPNKLGGYDGQTFARLKALAGNALAAYRPDVVISGMALGWDTALAHAALDASVPLIAAVAFEGQERVWPEDAQRHFHWILGGAREVVVVCPGGYSPRKLQIRNEWMVDNCDELLTLWDGGSGGTGNCIAYARSRVPERPIRNLWNSWSKYRDATS